MSVPFLPIQIGTLSLNKFNAGGSKRKVDRKSATSALSILGVPMRKTGVSRCLIYDISIVHKKITGLEV